MKALCLSAAALAGGVAIAQVVVRLRTAGEASAGELVGDLTVSALCALVAVFFARVALRSRITVSDEGLTIVNAVFSWQVGWPEVERATADRSGVVISLTDHREVRAAVRQKGNWAVWTGTLTESDKIAWLINDKVGLTERPRRPAKPRPES